MRAALLGLLLSAASASDPVCEEESALLQVRSDDVSKSGPPAASCTGDACLALNSMASTTPTTAFTNKEGCLAFIHIPKNAGGTIEKASHRQNVSLLANLSSYDEYRFWGKLDMHLFCENMWHTGANPQERACPLKNEGSGGACAIWHTPPALDQTLRDSYKPCETFCVVRNPLDKLISQYKYSNPSMASHCSTDHFNEWSYNNLLAVKSGNTKRGGCFFMPQHLYVFDQQNRRICNHILNHTTVAQDFAKLMRSRGSDAQLEDEVHVNHRLDNCEFKANASVKALVADIYKKDFESFGFTMPQ